MKKVCQYNLKKIIIYKNYFLIVYAFHFRTCRKTRGLRVNKLKLIGKSIFLKNYKKYKKDTKYVHNIKIFFLKIKLTYLYVFEFQVLLLKNIFYYFTIFTINTRCM